MLPAANPATGSNCALSIRSRDKTSSDLVTTDDYLS